MAKIITKPSLTDAARHEYSAKGRVTRVFDENGDGDLLPIGFDRRGDGSSFRLRVTPASTVYAEVESPWFSEPTPSA